MIHPSSKGTYALFLKAKKKFQCQVGRLGEMHGSVGCYAYIGSAFGPGGIAARIRHHLAISNRPHWHLDYVRPYLQPVEVWFSASPQRQEHLWADCISQLSGACIPLNGFGASDCQCQSHLFYFDALPTVKEFTDNLATLAGGGKKNTIELQYEVQREIFR